MKKFLPITVILLLLTVTSSFAHTINYDLSKMTRGGYFWMYLKLGFTHIIPLGLDHILFVLSIFFLSPKLKIVLWQATAFTVAHSITLGLAMYGIIKPISSIVEPVIALSIVFVALENFFAEKVNPWRVILIFCFGLVHGMGFASALTELGLPQTEFATALISFNLGVELGQVAVILTAYMLVGFWFGKKVWYRKRIVYPASGMIALIALYWTIERVFLVG